VFLSLGLQPVIVAHRSWVRRSSLRRTCASAAKGFSERVVARAYVTRAYASELAVDDVALGAGGEYSSAEVGLSDSQQRRVALVPSSRLQIVAERGDRALFGRWSDLRPDRAATPDSVL
jgi:hypothetical protein